VEELYFENFLPRETDHLSKTNEKSISNLVLRLSEYECTVLAWICLINKHLPPFGAKISSDFFCCGHLFREANSFLRAKLEENCELRGTDNVQGQISEHIFKVKYFSENWGISHIQSRDAFRPIASERKYLMDYNGEYHCEN